MSHDLQREMDVSTDSALSRDVSTLSEIVEPMESARLSADDVSGPTPPPAVALSREISMESGEGLQVWKRHKRHAFVFTIAGKPVYSRHGNDLEQSHVMGIAQALVLTSADIGDSLKSMTCGAFKLAVVCKPGLSLVAVSSAGDSVSHLRQQLEFLYGQILFLLTNKPVLTLLTSPSFDLRGLLGGTTGMLDGVLRAAQRSLSVCFGAIPILPLIQPSRNRAIAAMKCLAVPDVLYAILLAGDEVVCYIQPKSREFNLLSFDLVLLSNFIQSSTSLRQAETWTPVCFPKFRADGMLHAFVSCVGTVVSSMKPTVSAAARDARGSPAPAIPHRTPTDPDTSGADFMSPGSSATAAYLSSASLLPDKASTRHHTGIFLVLVSANTTPTHLTELARGKAAVVSELSTGPLLREIARSMGRKRFTAAEFEVDSLLHFVYLCTDTLQYTMPAFPGMFEAKKPRKGLLRWYAEVYHDVTSPFPSLKECVRRKPSGVLVGIVRDQHCLLALFEAGVQSGTAATGTEELLKRCKKDRARLFATPATW